MQRHPAFAIPFEPCDFGAAEAARAVNSYPFRAESDRRLHRPLHGAAEGDTALKLLGDRIGNEDRVDLGLAHLDNIDEDFGLRHLRNDLADLVDVGALLADHHAGARRMYRHPAFLMRPLDDDLRNRRLLEVLHERGTNCHVLVQELSIFGPAREPARIPGPVYAEPQADRIDFLSHRFLLTPERRRRRLPGQRSSAARKAYECAPRVPARAR